jgi:hypothetical protein
MHVGAADGRAFDFDQDAINAHFRLRHILLPEADSGIPFD